MGNHDENQTPSKPSYKVPKVKQNSLQVSPTNHHNERPSYGVISVESVTGAHEKLPHGNYKNPKPKKEKPNFKKYPSKEKEVHYITRPLPTHQPTIVQQNLLTHQPRPTSN